LQRKLTLDWHLQAEQSRSSNDEHHTRAEASKGHITDETGSGIWRASGSKLTDPLILGKDRRQRLPRAPITYGVSCGMRPKRNVLGIAYLDVARQLACPKTPRAKGLPHLKIRHPMPQNKDVEILVLGWTVAVFLQLQGMSLP